MSVIQHRRQYIPAAVRLLVGLRSSFEQKGETVDGVEGFALAGRLYFALSGANGFATSGPSRERSMRKSRMPDFRPSIVVTFPRSRLSY